MLEWLTVEAEVWRATVNKNGTYGIPTRLNCRQCSEPVPTSQNDRLRAGQADVISLYIVYSDVPDEKTERPRADDRLRLDGNNYRIRSVIPWPVVNTQYLEIFIEDEGKTY